MSDRKESYLVPFAFAEAEMTEKRSRFIGHIWPVDSEEEARLHIEEMRKQYHDATNSWCYIIRDGNIFRYSDGGEPQGTAGQPMLNVLQREEVTNVCCVVTRYYGGIPLGAGGLTRAYSSAAKLVLNEAGVSRMRLWTTLSILCPYTFYERLRLLASDICMITDTDFGEDVTLTVLLPSEETEGLCMKVTDITMGKVKPIVLGEDFQAGPRENAK